MLQINHFILKFEKSMIQASSVTHLSISRWRSHQLNFQPMRKETFDVYQTTNLGQKRLNVISKKSQIPHSNEFLI